MFVVVVSFLNEASHLPGLLESLAAQTRPPDRLLLNDDGSTDGSGELAQAFAAAHEGAVVLRRPVRPPERDRLIAAQELVAFQWALEQVPGWEVAGKVDADMVLTPGALATIEEAFRADPRLGMAGPYLAERGRDGRLARMRTRPEHVPGQMKFYRRACYEEIGPLPAIIGWDMFDTPAARLRGWRTASLEVPSGDPEHTRPMGSYDGRLRGWRRWGRGAYAMGEPFAHVFLHTLLRVREPPPVLGAANYLAGWFGGMLGRAPRADPEVRALVRRELMGRVRARARRLGRRTPEPAAR